MTQANRALEKILHDADAPLVEQRNEEATATPSPLHPDHAKDLRRFLGRFRDPELDFLRRTIVEQTQ